VWIIWLLVAVVVVVVLVVEAEVDFQRGLFMP
jgi:hypothetical protein